MDTDRSRMSLESRNPHDNSLIASYAEHGAQQVEEILALVHGAHKSWRGKSITVRVKVLTLLSAGLREELENHALLISREMGKALKKSVLELCGSDPCIVLADADIQHAAKVCAAARLVNSGQSCIAAKRFIAVDAVHDAAGALAIANDSPFGLGGAIFSADKDAAWEYAADLLDTGAVAVNSQLVSDPGMPFGGIKDSGYGRELGVFGIREFVNIKSVVSI